MSDDDEVVLDWGLNVITYSQAKFGYDIHEISDILSVSVGTKFSWELKFGLAIAAVGFVGLLVGKINLAVISSIWSSMFLARGLFGIQKVLVLHKAVGDQAVLLSKDDAEVWRLKNAIDVAIAHRSTQLM